MIDDGASARSLNDDADVQAHQFQRIAVADVDTRERRPAAIAVPDLRVSLLRHAAGLRSELRYAGFESLYLIPCILEFLFR